MPRSGTTWLARLLARAPGSALAGREPMNPHPGQYRLGGAISEWTRLERADPRTSRALVRAYRASTPRVYSRYGVRRWAAPLPGTRLVVKDPFALLSLPVVAAVTAARPVVVHRHPGAMLASYRRMGWLPDLEEIAPIVATYTRGRGPADPEVPALPPATDPASATAMGWFWSALYAMALADLPTVPGALVVSHERIATDPAACRRLHQVLEVPWGEAADAEFARAGSGDGRESALHNFDRAPADVAVGWRSRLDDDEVAEIERITEPVRDHIARVETRASDSGTR